jgi:hypothetical protein
MRWRAWHWGTPRGSETKWGMVLYFDDPKYSPSKVLQYLLKAPAHWLAFLTFLNKITFLSVFNLPVPTCANLQKSRLVYIKNPKMARFARRQHVKILDDSVIWLARRFFWNLPMTAQLFNASMAVNSSPVECCSEPYGCPPQTKCAGTHSRHLTWFRRHLSVSWGWGSFQNLLTGSMGKNAYPGLLHSRGRCSTVPSPVRSSGKINHCLPEFTHDADTQMFSVFFTVNACSIERVDWAWHLASQLYHHFPHVTQGHMARSRQHSCHDWAA